MSFIKSYFLETSLKTFLTKTFLDFCVIIFKFFNCFISMPELPEVETVRLALSDHFLKCKICKIVINTKKLRFFIPLNFSKNFTGKKINLISRHGKYIIINFSSQNSLLVHLGMTGIFRISNSYKKKKHDHIIFYFEKKVLVYNDVRKFGFFKTYKLGEVNSSKHIVKLGIDPLDKNFNINYFRKFFKDKKINIKSFLMNQENISGLGNIYCSEILFDCNISPLRCISFLKELEKKKLIFSIKRILSKAIKKGGTSLKDFFSPDGDIGYFKNELKVYGREKKDCLNCGKNSKVKKVKQQGRSTFFCSKCQV